MAEAMMASRFFASAKGKPYFRTEPLQLDKEMAMVYIKSENNETPVSVVVPKAVLHVAPTVSESTSTVNITVATSDKDVDAKPSKKESIQKFRETYIPPMRRKPKFQQMLRLEQQDGPVGCYSGTVHATHPSCVIVKFRIDKQVTPVSGMQVWPVEKFFDESMDESKGRKYLTRQYDIDDVLGAFELWTPSDEDDEDEQEDISKEENAACRTHIDDVASADISSGIKTETNIIFSDKDAGEKPAEDEGSHFLLARVAKHLDTKDLTKVARHLDTKHLVDILARCFDAPGKANVDSISPDPPQDQNSAVVKPPIQVQRAKEKVTKVERSGGNEIALSLNQSHFARFPIHCPVTFKACKRAEVKGAYYNFEQKAYTYRIKLEQSGFCLHVSKETDLTFAPDCPVIYKDKAASVVSASSCGNEFSVKYNGDEVIHIGVSKNNVKFYPSQLISVKNKKATHQKRIEIPVETNNNEPIATSRVESRAGFDAKSFDAGKESLVGNHQKTTNSLLTFKRIDCAKERTDQAECAHAAKNQKNNRSNTTAFLNILNKSNSAKKRKYQTQWAPSAKTQKHDPAYTPIIRKENHSFVVEMPLMRGGGTFKNRGNTE